MRQPPLASFLRNQPLIRMAKMSGWFFHSEAVFPKLREFGFFPRGYSHSERMYFQGWQEALEACLQRRADNLENKIREYPRFSIFFLLIVRMAP